MAIMFDLVVLCCRYHMRMLQLHLGSYFRPNVHPDSRLVPLTDPMQEELAWWASIPNLMIGTQLPAPSIDYGRVAIRLGGPLARESCLRNMDRTGVTCSHQSPRTLGRRALLLFESRVMGRNIFVQSDYSTVVAFVNKQGRTLSRPPVSVRFVSLHGAGTQPLYCLQFTSLGL